MPTDTTIVKPTAPLLDDARLAIAGFLAGTPVPPGPATPPTCGRRISETLHIDIEHLGIQRGHGTVTVLGKGSKLAVIPLRPRVAGPWTWPPGAGPAVGCCWDAMAIG